MYKGINITFTSLKTLEGRRGVAVTANIVYNGKKIATYSDEGIGGEPNVYPIGKTKEQVETNKSLLNQLNQEFEQLSPLESEGFSLKECIPFAVDNFLLEKECLKEAKKGIVFQNGNQVSILSPFTKPINVLLKESPKHKDAIIKNISSIIEQMQKDGHTILCQQYYISLGVNLEIFTKR